jgi:hypothetical protein
MFTNSNIAGLAIIILEIIWVLGAFWVWVTMRTDDGSEFLWGKGVNRQLRKGKRGE